MTQPASLERLGDGQFALSGDLVFESAPRLLLEGEAAFGAVGRAEIDLARVGRIDSAGLALLRHLGEEGGQGSGETRFHVANRFLARAHVPLH